ncbi:MAG: hypothetical protein AAF497_12955 [Planctomycetota bacterium]
MKAFPRSLEIHKRTEGVNWWPNEELEQAQHDDVIASYKDTLPKVVIAHDCPTEIVDLVATIRVDDGPSRTTALLQYCFDTHAPKTWIFGHYHHNWVYQHPRGTTFICIVELCYYDLDQHGNPMFAVPR